MAGLVVDRSKNKPHIERGATGTTARLSPVRGATGPPGTPGPGSAAWAAAQSVTVGAVRQAPDGSWIKSTADRTTGATFDVTEQTFWTTVGATSGTLEQVALAATYARIGQVFMTDPTLANTGADAAASMRAATAAAVAAMIADDGPTTVLVRGRGVLDMLTASILTPPATTADPYPNTYNYQGVQLPTNLPHDLTIEFEAGTTIRLSATCKNVFCIKKLADYDVFQNVHFILNGLTVDVDNVPNRGHDFIGNVPGFDTSQRFMSFDNITIDGGGAGWAKMINVPTDPTAVTNTHRGWLYFYARHNGYNEATQTFSTNIAVRRTMQYGGDFSILVSGPAEYGGLGSAGTTNHYYDNVVYEDVHCEHSPTAPVDYAFQTSFQIGGAGRGKYGRITNAESINSADDGIECGAMQTLVLDKIRTVNSNVMGVYLRLNDEPIDQRLHKVTIRDWTHTITADFFAAAAAGEIQSQALRCLADVGSSEFGHLVLEDCTTVIDAGGGGITKMTRPSTDLGWHINGPWARVDQIRCGVLIKELDYDRTNSSDWTMFDSVLTGRALPTAGATIDFADAVHVLRDCWLEMEEISSSGTGSAAFRPIVFQAGGAQRILIDGFDAQFKRWATPVTSNGVITLLRVAGTAYLPNLTVRRMRPLRAGVPGFGGVGFRFLSGAHLGVIDIDDSDLRGLNAAGTNELDIEYGVVPLTGITDAQSVRLGPGMRWLADHGFKSVADAAYTMTRLTTSVAVTGLTAARNITLPRANAVPPGAEYLVQDGSNLAATYNINVLVDSRTLTVGTTDLSPTVTGAFVGSDIGRRITGTGIPAGATITAVTVGASCTISANATATASVTGTVRDKYYDDATSRSISSNGSYRRVKSDGISAWTLVS